MTTLRIKIKIGDNEFEADGAPDDVQAQVALFTRLLGHKPEPAAAESIPPPPSAISQIAHVAGKVVSLNVDSESLENAVLVLLLGQRELRGNPLVAGTEIMAGLRSSGHVVERADHILKRHAMTGHIVSTGRRRQRRYRLTTDGVEKARKIALELAASVPQEGKA